MVKKALRKPTNQPDTTKKRMVTLTVLLFLAFLVIVGRLFQLQVVSGSDYRSLAQDQYTLVKKLTPVRGEIKIMDHYSGQPYTVATSLDKDLAYAVPESITDQQAFAKSVSEILGMTMDDVMSKISDRSKKYVVLKHELSDDEESRLKALKLTGLNFDPETVRFYPENAFLSQVLGYVGYADTEKTGRYGLEQYFNTQLSGTPGSIDQEKDASGVWIFGGKRDVTPAQNGQTLVLTIDKNIQFQTESILKEAVTDHGADSGSAIVMDPKTGAILAMATYPSFDPNQYSKAKSPQVYSNQPTVGSYEPGSIFKPITMAMAVNEGKVGPGTTYVDTGEINVDGFKIQNSDHKAHGTQTMSQVLEESLNTGAIFAKDQIGNKLFTDYVHRFGFGKDTGIELPEAAGNLSGLNTNVEVNFDTATFGQGINVTPIQLMQAYSAFANGGKMMKPFIVGSTVDYKGKSTVTVPQVVGQPISAQTASAISAMLVNVVELGHGKKAGVKGYYVGGKTGTAQVPRQDGKGYDPNDNIGSFIGYAPIEDPKFIAIVRVNHPRDVQFAESSAAPAFGKIAQFLLNYFNVQPTRPVSGK